MIHGGRPRDREFASPFTRPGPARFGKSLRMEAICMLCFPIGEIRIPTATGPQMGNTSSFKRKTRVRGASGLFVRSNIMFVNTDHLIAESLSCIGRSHITPEGDHAKQNHDQ